MKDAKPKVIVIRKRDKGHGGHHGGSWKVAYADFVTAMMAFFLVMWIMGMDQDVKDLVQGYFNNPLGTNREISHGLNPATTGSLIRTGFGSGVPVASSSPHLAELELVARNLEERFDSLGLHDLGAEVEVVVTPEGLRIEIMELSDEEVFFEKGSAGVRPTLRRILTTITEELGDMPLPLVVEGHTDARPFARPGPYGNWELSVDRANAARRVMVEGGFAEGQFSEVRGYADRRPRVAADPLAARNRRVTLLMPVQRPVPLNGPVQDGFPSFDPIPDLPRPMGTGGDSQPMSSGETT